MSAFGRSEKGVRSVQPTKAARGRGGQAGALLPVRQQDRHDVDADTKVIQQRVIMQGQTELQIGAGAREDERIPQSFIRAEVITRTRRHRVLLAERVRGRRREQAAVDRVHVSETDGI